MSGRYQVQHPLEGGLDVRVYLAADRWLPGRQLVLTLLPKDISKSSRRFELEDLYAQRASLDHPSLVRIHDVAFRGKRVGIVSEFIDGQAMAGKLGSVWSVEGRRLIAIQLAELLCYLHGKGCACGYLTPSQLFVLPGDTLFANILLLERSPSRGTRSGQWIRYIAPELLTGEKASRQSDLYSLGMLFYHLFTGHPPYAEQDSEVLKSKQLAIFPVKARKLNPDIPACIEELIHELIQKDARLRPKDAQQIVALLKNGTERPTALPRLRAPLMGRDIELANFRSLFEEHVAGKSAHFLAIRGVSGIGKTFLMERFGIITKLRGAVSYTVSHHRNSGIFAAFRQLVHKAPAHKKSESKIGMRKLNDERSKTLNPDLFFQNLLRFLGEFSAGRPVVLCANDLQWMDEGWMCCNFQKAASERWVGSIRLRLMHPPRTAC